MLTPSMIGSCHPKKTKASSTKIEKVSSVAALYERRNYERAAITDRHYTFTAAKISSRISRCP